MYVNLLLPKHECRFLKIEKLYKKFHTCIKKKDLSFSLFSDFRSVIRKKQTLNFDHKGFCSNRKNFC